MSYRSDVLIKLPTSKFDYFKSKCYEKCDLSKELFENNKVYSNVGRRSAWVQIISENSEFGVPQTSLRWYGIKWYECFPDINAIMETIDEFGKEGLSISYGRVGEEDGDIDRFHYEASDEEEIDYIYATTTLE